MSLSSKLLGARKTDFQHRRGTKREPQSIIETIFLDTRPIQHPNKELRLPWTQPAQDRPGRGERIKPLQSDLRHRAGVVGQRKSRYPAWPPPLRHVSAIEQQRAGLLRDIGFV